MLYGRDYGIRNVKWSVDQIGRLKTILARIPLIKRFFTKKIRVDLTALTKEGRPIMGTFRSFYIPHGCTYIEFDAALGADVLCHGAEKYMCYVSDEKDRRYGERFGDTTQSQLSRWTTYTLNIKENVS